MGRKSLAENNPTLATEWHPTLNGDLTPSDVTAGSSKKVWWQCSQHPDHHWAAALNGRNNGSGCPYCSNRKVLPGYNDLSTTNRELAEEWHPTLNGDLTPMDVTGGSNKRVWWRCRHNKAHQWESGISYRGLGGCCPHCSKSSYRETNSLATANPTLAKEWCLKRNGALTPEDVQVWSHRKVWWQCRKHPKHQWEAVIGNRSSGGGCPFCIGRKAVPGETDLATVNPVLAKEWHASFNGDLNPSDVVTSSNKRVWWQCQEHQQHQWKAAIGRRHNGTGCPYCRNRKAWTGYNDLATINPKLAKEWQPALNESLKPSEIGGSSETTVWWQCVQGHEWQAISNTRNNGHSHCGECKNN